MEQSPRLLLAPSFRFILQTLTVSLMPQLITAQ
jgi:hypothetical protein